ncbi:AraC family transcriptional regulator [Paenibacillus sp. NFR01]|uniref:helix-turn-helix domain-containing protein n=1 Tax=Paenibacillus sp. NFR01 TaxID=1566279 RepID=UPI0008BEBC8A|nr:AraC family transcriptional regulator [Paenibacillus sp. NFR01]SEU26134.1 AraC-type DNA-binding protein [Paenibacillus sp. NFR01]
MNDVPVYRDTGEHFFNHGDSIYMNYVSEPATPHRHEHDFIEISYVASGTGIHILGDKQYEVCAGDLFLINYHVPHEFRSLDDPGAAPLMVYNCVFKPDFIDVNLLDYREFADVIHYLSFHSIFALEAGHIDDLKILGGGNRLIESVYQKMLAEFTRQDDGYIELLRAYLIELLITIFRSLKKSSGQPAGALSPHAAWIEKSKQYLKANYAIGATLNELASQSFLSPTYFCRLFKDHTGMTISEYTQKLRIEEACHLLQSGGDKIIAVAEKVGYKDLKHFNEVFKKHTGITPGAYKKLLGRDGG